MSIAAITELRSGGVKMQVSDKKLVREHNRTFRIITSAYGLRPYDVLVEAQVLWGLPQILDHHPTDFAASVRSVACDYESPEQAITYIAKVSYSTENSTESEDNPLNEPVKLSWQSGRRKRAIVRDLEGKACVNTVGDPFDPPIEIDVSAGTLKAVRNELAFSPNIAGLFDNHVNSAMFFGRAPGTVRCSIDADQQFSNGFQYWSVTYQFEVDPLGWQPRPLNQGLYQKDAELGRIRILDANHTDITIPVPISLTGQKIKPSDLPDAAVFLEFAGYGMVDFNALGLPI